MQRKITKKERQRYIKHFKNLTIKDDFMFCKVMQHEDICSQVLNIVLKDHHKIAKIKHISSQKDIKNHPELKSVRLDILVEDEDGNSYDIEMQVINNKNIRKRMRVYQAAIDMSKINKGMDYNKIGDAIIIFFCMFDPIDEGLPVYFFENYCTQDKDIKMNDGTYKVILNVPAWEKLEDGELKALLRYFFDGYVNSKVAKEIDMKTIAIKGDSTITEEYISAYTKYWDIRREGEQVGIKKGIIKGKIEGKIEGIKSTAKNLLMIGVPIDKIMQATGLSKDELESLR